MTTARLTRNGSRVLVVLLTISACSPLASVSPSPTQVPSSGPTAAPTSSQVQASGSPSLAPTDAPAASPAAAKDIEFVRWNSQRVLLIPSLEPGGPGTGMVEGTGDEPIAAVLERRVISGTEWIRVQVGRGSAYDYVVNGWVPHDTYVEEGGQTVHVDPVYEFIEPDCPATTPTIGDLDGMLPLLSVHCLGSQELTFTQVQVRDQGSEDAESVEGTPEWLVKGGNLVAYWLPERREYGSIRLYIDPASRIEVPLSEWIAITGHLDDPAAQECTRSSDRPEFQVANQQEAAQICRGRFVVTGVRALTESEIPTFPPLPSPLPVGGPVRVDVRITAAPAAKRGEPTSVWTGSKLLIWGGWSSDVHDPPLLNDGDTYEPATGAWGSISKAPIQGRWGAVGTWTGSEMIVWGGNHTEDERLSDGAAYDPAPNTWRTIAAAPMEWNDQATSAWTGTEWWIAVGARDGATNVAAYDPVADSWRSMPSIPDEWADTPQIVWTGSEILLLTAAGLFETGPSDSDWIAHGITDLNGPAVWTGDLFVGMGTVPTSEDPLDFGYLSLAIGWDPVSDEQVALPPPPRSVYESMYVADNHLAFIESGLALDLASGRWLELAVNQKGQAAMETEFGSEAWAGDRLLVWGGDKPCSDVDVNTKDIFELIPDWSAGEASAIRLDTSGDQRAIRAYAC